VPMEEGDKKQSCRLFQRCSGYDLYPFDSFFMCVFGEPFIISVIVVARCTPIYGKSEEIKKYLTAIFPSSRATRAHPL